MSQFDESSARLIWPDHDHRFGKAGSNVEQRTLYSHRVAFKDAFGDKFHRAAVERSLDAGESGPTKGVILVKDRDPTDTEILCEMLHHRLGLLVVGSTDVDDIGLVGIAQELGSREGSDERYASI